MIGGFSSGGLILVCSVVLSTFEKHTSQDELQRFLRKMKELEVLSAWRAFSISIYLHMYVGIRLDI